MAVTIPIYKLDAFASNVFSGNPAAVCPLIEWLPDQLMQAIAAENNLSETAFIVGSGAAYSIRWFTPEMEVDLCGHATLAAAYVVSHYLSPDVSSISFQSRSGPLGVQLDADKLVLDFPRAELKSQHIPAAMTQALGATPDEYFRCDYDLAVFSSEAQIAALKPDFAALKPLAKVGLIVSAPGDTVDFVSRFFAPAAGINEDPVTGSAHCILVPYWARRLDKTHLSARQISARGGELDCVLKGDRVLISGRVVPFLVGEIQI